MSELDLSIEAAPAAADLEVLREGLHEHSREFVATPGFEELAVFSRDAHGNLQGGIYGRLNWEWLHVTLLWVSPERRGEGLGSALLRRIEAVATERGCGHAHLDTLGYQAKEFYERHGYEVFATLEEYPRGYERSYLRKRIGDPQVPGTEI